MRPPPLRVCGGLAEERLTCSKATPGGGLAQDITRVVANIPYQISSPLIDVITRYHRNPNTTPLQDVVMLVQEEFAERVVMEYRATSVRWAWWWRWILTPIWASACHLTPSRHAQSAFTPVADDAPR